MLQVHNIKYKQYVKEALVEALQGVFADHPDPLLRTTKVSIDFPLDELAYPAIVVRFYERQIKNFGIAHREIGEVTDSEGFGTGQFRRYRHYLYNGDIEFAIYALSSYDRDLISDSLIQTLTMADTEFYTDQFLDRIYQADPALEPTSLDHFINLNTDVISGFGETQQPAPWQPEDVLVYQTAYRIAIFGEFYSRTPEVETFGVVSRVDAFPYNEAAGEEVPDPPAPGPDGEYGTADDQPDPQPWEGEL